MFSSRLSSAGEFILSKLKRHGLLSCDPKEVEAALLAVAHQHPQVIDSPAPQVMFMRFGDSSLDFELLVWTQDPSKELPLKSDLYYQIHEIVKKQQIEIPFPQRDLHVHLHKKSTSQQSAKE